MREMLQTVNKAAAPPQRSSSIREVFNENRHQGVTAIKGLQITELLLIVTFIRTMCSNWAQLPEFKDAAAAAACWLVSAVAEYAPDSPQLLRNLLMLINIIITPSHTRNFKYLNTEF